jgi:hypothetical protein
LVHANGYLLVLFLFVLFIFSCYYLACIPFTFGHVFNRCVVFLPSISSFQISCTNILLHSVNSEFILHYSMNEITIYLSICSSMYKYNPAIDIFFNLFLDNMFYCIRSSFICFISQYAWLYIYSLLY